MKCYAQRSGLYEATLRGLQTDLKVAREHRRNFVELGDRYAEDHFDRTVQGALDRINNALEQGEKESK